MSVPELPSNISSPEEKFQASLRRIYLLIDYMRLYINKSQERLQTLFNSMVAQHQNFKLQMEPRAVSGSNIYLSKVTSHIFFSADMDPDLLAGFYNFQGIGQVFFEPSNIDHHTSRLRTQTRFITSLSCDLKPDINKPISREILVSYDLALDMSASIYSGREIS